LRRTKRVNRGKETEEDEKPKDRKIKWRMKEENEQKKRKDEKNK
jgi:hypothetical protein